MNQIYVTGPKPDAYVTGEAPVVHNKSAHVTAKSDGSGRVGALAHCPSGPFYNRSPRATALLQA